MAKLVPAPKIIKGRFILSPIGNNNNDNFSDDQKSLMVSSSGGRYKRKEDPKSNAKHNSASAKEDAKSTGRPKAKDDIKSPGKKAKDDSQDTGTPKAGGRRSDTTPETRRRTRKRSVSLSFEVFGRAFSIIELDKQPSKVHVYARDEAAHLQTSFFSPSFSLGKFTARVGSVNRNT